MSVDQTITTISTLPGATVGADIVRNPVMHDVTAKLVGDSLEQLPEDVRWSVVDAYTGGQGATEGSAGIDLRYCGKEPLVLRPGEQELIGTGLSIHLNDPNLVGICAPRSGRGNAGLVLGNTIGIIDEDYQGELKLCLLNRLSRREELEDDWMVDQNTIVIQPGERVAQYMVIRRELIALNFVDDYTDVTGRGDGGFGHSGRL